MLVLSKIEAFCSNMSGYVLCLYLYLYWQANRVRKRAGAGAVTLHGLLVCPLLLIWANQDPVEERDKSRLL